MGRNEETTAHSLTHSFTHSLTHSLPATVTHCQPLSLRVRSGNDKGRNGRLEGRCMECNTVLYYKTQFRKSISVNVIRVFRVFTRPAFCHTAFHSHSSQVAIMSMRTLPSQVLVVQTKNHFGHGLCIHVNAGNSSSSTVISVIFSLSCLLCPSDDTMTVILQRCSAALLLC